MAVTVWHLDGGSLDATEVAAWVHEGRLAAPGHALPRAGDVVFLRACRGACVVGRVREDATFGGGGNVLARVSWRPIGATFPRMRGTPRGEGLLRANAHSWHHRIEADKWLSEA